MNICLISPHLLTRNVYVTALMSIKGIDYVFDFENFEECEKFLIQKRVDAILIDVKLNDVEFEHIKRLQSKFQSMKFIIMAEQDEVLQVLSLGASYVVKDMLLDDFVRIVETTLKGNMFIAAFAVEIITELVREKFEIKRHIEHYDLSEREIEILNLITQGKSNTQIGDELALSPFTIKNYISKIIEKMEVKTRTEATAKAFKFGLVTG